MQAFWSVNVYNSPQSILRKKNKVWNGPHPFMALKGDLLLDFRHRPNFFRVYIFKKIFFINISMNPLKNQTNFSYIPEHLLKDVLEDTN